mmetsp:Transcript_2190/g.3303  ORF Transcript_2190/g.3303 Transcript_2190/m.3303 type:complete len:255 (-) Transcript_2190:84-848(-)|eukprot:CAMPEP_0175059486 /NCGR_PEP_ID=MMETSP0052_2-20121109/12459_1 /TAXON_ID=51329 ORGANISM="Polytomella parva, Strain SAG 63-3" /NCGR_SAMPLE_ID=MMETSP0052_2 /ASSEMBLY_ACC=CAM_ASM_000194 /LENGTH=254 /DNA_ID=CAMNT_0016325041 /DNA_START=33 /DNA_END=797 /DNA_ORIENTATION=+
MSEADKLTVQELSADKECQRIERLVRKTETVLKHRTGRFLLVLERCTDNQNYLSCLRTADILGIQDVWIVLSNREDSSKFDEDEDSVVDKGQISRKRGRIARGTSQWLDLRFFKTTTDCIQALKNESWSIWSTDLGPGTEALEEVMEFPKKLAIVMGREADGVSQEMLQASNNRVRLSMFGFSDSFNISVATGMVLQTLFLRCPSARGTLSQERINDLRDVWFDRLSKSPAQKDAMKSLSNKLRSEQEVTENLV